MVFCEDEFISNFPLRMSFSGNAQISLKCCFSNLLNHLQMKKFIENAVETSDRLAMAILVCSVNWQLCRYAHKPNIMLPIGFLKSSFTVFFFCNNAIFSVSEDI